MSRWQADDDEARLDALLARTQASAIAAIKGALDLEAGKRAIFAMHSAGRLRSAVPDHGPLAEVGADIAMMLALLRTCRDDGAAHDAAMPYVHAIRHNLTLLQSGLPEHTLDRDAAVRLAAHAGHALREARRRLRITPVRQAPAEPSELLDALDEVDRRLQALRAKLTHDDITKGVSP
ncbi:hypothetical protein OIE66_06050 [Nonomuraea sp. NBC_01738]|uniref:hypothetical protein n=1 Tax=Nonomuraea sp. NBC_01738 TaxID=2976003 RepID=UPI002E167678|nr:hypothetical protein OIE66_06050 [Nonomuraea sp. NBC_01738]